MRELGQRAGGASVLDHALDPFHALLEGALTETRRRMAEREPELVQRRSEPSSSSAARRPCSYQASASA